MDYLRHARELQRRDDNPTAPRLPALVHVVDDDEAVRDSFRVMLEASGYAARTWASGIDLLRAIPGIEPGCIVVDVRMPDIDGLTLLRKLRDGKVRLPIIVITGHGDIPMAVEAMKAGAVDFVEKPFVQDSMLESIRMALRQT